MITLLLESMMSVLYELGLVLIPYPFLCYTFLTLLTVSSVIIAIKVKSNPPPQHSSAVASERKFSVTFSIVTVVSILTILLYLFGWQSRITYSVKCLLQSFT